MRVKRSSMEQRYEKKLNMIAEQIVSRYEGELNKVGHLRFSIAVLVHITNQQMNKMIQLIVLLF